MRFKPRPPPKMNEEFYKLFKPELTPKMLELGVFGGSYFVDGDKGVP